MLWLSTGTSWRVWVSAAVLHAGHIGKAKAETAGAFFCLIVIGDLPEHVGPLGITGEKNDTGLTGGQREHSAQLDRLEIARVAPDVVPLANGVSLLLRL